MGINLTEANTQARNAAAYAVELQNIKRDLGNYQSTLQQHWQASEMALINNAIEVILQKLNAAATELESLGGERGAIYSAALAVKQLEDAQDELKNAQSALKAAERTHALALSAFTLNPNPLTNAAWIQAKNALSAATARRNTAEAKVRSLS